MAFMVPTEVVRQAALNPSAKVADFGAGSGHYTFAAASAVGAEGRVYAVEVIPDLAKRIVAHARELQIKNVEALTGDIEAPNGSGLPDHSVDVVIIANLLFQIEEKGRLFAEAARVLRRGGMMLLVDWTDSFAGLGPQDDQVIPKDAARKLAESRGFTFVRDIDAGDHHWGMVMRVV